MTRKSKKRHVIRYMDGSPIDWNNPPRPGKMVKWVNKFDSRGKMIRGDFRSICALYDLDKKARRRFGVGLTIYQQDLNRDVDASAGTHDWFAVFDIGIKGVGWWVVQKFVRQNGWGGWYRWTTYIQGVLLWLNHCHMFLVPPHTKNVSQGFMRIKTKVGKFIDGGWSLFGRVVGSSQISDFYHKRNGLKDHGPDKGWHPADHGGVQKYIFDLNRFCEAQAELQNAA